MSTHFSIFRMRPESHMRRMLRRRTSLQVGVACMALVFSVNVIGGQQESTPDVNKPPSRSEPVQHDYRFEVAAIRPTDPYSLTKAGTLHPYSPGRYRQERIYLGALLGEAFGIEQYHQIKYPKWMHTAYFAVDATLPEGATKADLPVMIRHLLEDRFALKYHHETRQMAGYELVVAKSGPKVTKSTGPLPDPSTIKEYGFEIKNGVPQFSNDQGPQQIYHGSATGLVAWWYGRDETMQRLVSDIASRLNVPVSDATGLEGTYDFSLKFMEESSAHRVAVDSLTPDSVAAGANGAPAPPEYPLLRDALREQLGLELKPVKNVAVDVVVIDSANKMPTEN